jgi:cytosine/adenosine deaminase-related metal-dependent hydrolase
MGAMTSGLVCGHHHLYSALARGMPAPPETPTGFLSILRQVWWRLDTALDTEMLHWSAMLGATEALLAGTTAIIDHHESPNAIEGSLTVLADACTAVGVRLNVAYGVTDRWADDGSFDDGAQGPPAGMTGAARRGLAECERFLRAGGRGMVGLHAGFTCSDDTIEAAADLARTLGVGVHVHVAEGPVDADAGRRLAAYATDDWLLVHCVHLDRELPGTIAHNPRSNMNNAVGYARPARRPNRVVLGTDGIGADMLEELRLAYARLREDDVMASPELPWQWLRNGEAFFPEVAGDRVTWSYDHVDDPWRLVFTPGARVTDVVRADGEVLVRGGRPTRVDLDGVRAKAAEQAERLFERLA